VYSIRIFPNILNKIRFWGSKECSDLIEKSSGSTNSNSTSTLTPTAPKDASILNHFSGSSLHRVSEKRENTSYLQSTIASSKFLIFLRDKTLIKNGRLILLNENEIKNIVLPSPQPQTNASSNDGSIHWTLEDLVLWSTSSETPQPVSWTLHLHRKKDASLGEVNVPPVLVFLGLDSGSVPLWSLDISSLQSLDPFSKCMRLHTILHGFIYDLETFFCRVCRDV
jgi:hypothetical protein